MKLINEKGKLFGLINVIDLVVVLAIVAAGYIVFSKLNISKTINVLDNKKPYEMQVLVKAILPVMTGQISVGDVFLEDASNAVLGTVTDIKVETAKNEVSTADGRVVIAEVENREDLLLTLKGDGIFDDKRGLVFGNKDWQAGATMVIKSNRVKFLGNIYSITVE